MKTIIELGKEAGLITWGFVSNEYEVVPDLEAVERLVGLVRADEREACAKLIESRKSGANELMDSVRDLEARAIRAKGNT